MSESAQVAQTLGAQWLHAYANDKPLPLWNEAEWRALVGWARRNDLITVLADQVYKLPTAPAPIRAELQTVWLESAARNTMMLTLASRVLAALRQAHCPIIVLKGAVIAETLYRNIACRAMSDIDVLIQPTHLDQTITVLTTQGFHYPAQDFVGHSTGYAARYRGEMHLYSKRLEIDLHWRLFTIEWLTDVIHINLDAVWARACPVQIEKATAWQLCGEDALWYLGLHLGLHHAGMQPRMMLDIDRLVRMQTSGDFDWDVFTQRCLEYRIAGFVYTALFATRHWLGTPIPEAVMQALAPARWQWHWITRLTHLETHLDAAVDLARGKDRLLQWVTVRGWQDRFAMVRYALVPSSAWIAERYGAQSLRAVWAWRLHHWVRLVRTLFRKQMIRKSNKSIH